MIASSAGDQFVVLEQGGALPVQRADPGPDPRPGRPAPGSGPRRPRIGVRNVEEPGDRPFGSRRQWCRARRLPAPAPPGGAGRRPAGGSGLALSGLALSGFGILVSIDEVVQLSRDATIPARMRPWYGCTRPGSAAGVCRV